MNRKIIAASALALALLGGLGAAAWVLGAPPSAQEYADRYNEVARAHQATAWTLPPLLEGTPARDEDPTAAYRALLEEITALERERGGLAESVPSALTSPWSRVEGDAPPLAPACRELGIPADTPDLTTRGFTDAHCEALATWSPQIDALLALGAYRRPGQPLGLWDPWTHDPSRGAGGATAPWITLSKLAFERAYFEYVRTGDLDPWIEVHAALSRVRANLTHGAGLLNVMSAQIERPMLLVMLYDFGPMTTRSQDERIIDIALHARSYPDTFHAAVQSVFLETYGQILPNDPALLKPPSATTLELRRALEERSLVERALAMGEVRRELDRVADLARDLPGEHARRQERYERYAPDGVEAPIPRFEFARYDFLVNEPRIGWCMVALAFAERLAQRDGSPRARVGELDPRVVEECAEDGFSGEPYEVVTRAEHGDQQARYLRSPYGHDSSYPELGVYANQVHHLHKEVRIRRVQVAARPGTGAPGR